jgi:hypothetical protein
MRKDSGLVLNDSANVVTCHYCVGRGAFGCMFVSLFGHVCYLYCIFYGAVYNRTCWEKGLGILIKKIWKYHVNMCWENHEQICPMSWYILHIFVKLCLEKNKYIKMRTYSLHRIHKQLGSVMKCNVVCCKYLN